MEYYNLFIPLIFLGTTGLTIGLFYRATNKSRRTALAIMMSWVVLQTVLSLSGFYKNHHFGSAQDPAPYSAPGYMHHYFICFCQWQAIYWPVKSGNPLSLICDPGSG